MIYQVITRKEPGLFGPNVFSLPFGGESYTDAKDWAAYYQEHAPNSNIHVCTVGDTYSLINLNVRRKA